MSLASVPCLPAVDLIRTELGWCGFAWEGDTLTGIAVGYDSQVDAVRAVAGENVAEAELRGEFVSRRAVERSKLPDPAARMAAAFLAYFEGERVTFPDAKLLRLPSTGFASTVIAACRAIPYGEVRSYGEIAGLAGSPRASRAVGNAMRTNRYPVLIPCHRVIAAQGRLGGYSSPRGLDFKRRLLEMEARGKGAAKGS